MTIRIGTNTDYLEIKDILPEGKELCYESQSVEFLRGTLALQTEGITTNIRASFMIDEIKGLKSDLNKLYESLKYQFVFKNLEDNVEMKFVPTSNGQIEISGYLRNKSYSVKVDFSIITDQTFLPVTINQIEEALNLY